MITYLTTRWPVVRSSVKIGRIVCPALGEKCAFRFILKIQMPPASILCHPASGHLLAYFQGGIVEEDCFSEALEQRNSHLNLRTLPKTTRLLHNRLKDILRIYVIHILRSSHRR